MRHRSLPVALAGIAVVGLGLAACTPASDGSADTSGAAAAGSDSCVTEAQAVVDEASADLDLIVPEQPLDTANLEGESFWFITVAMNQFSIDMYTGFEEAAAAAGATSTSFDSEGAVSKSSEGIEQAVAQGASGIVLVGIEPTLVAEPLVAAEAAGIPVLSFENDTYGADVVAGTFGNMTADFARNGAVGAAWSAVQTGCATNMVLLESSLLPIWTALTDGAEAELDRLCPETCTAKTIDVDLANVSTSISSQLQTALQVDPGVTHVFAAWDSAVPFVGPAVASAAGEIQVMGHDGTTAAIQTIVAGHDQQFTMATPPIDWIGWSAFDVTARAFLGDETESFLLPARLIDFENIGDGSVQTIFPAYVDYQDAFVAAWNGE